MSISSTRILSEKAEHSVWKYLIPPSGLVVVVLSPGSMIAGAEGEGGRGLVGERRGGGVWELMRGRENARNNILNMLMV